MLSLEEYLSQRKKDEGIVDRDRTAKYKNAKKCMGFVLDYYTEYLDTVPQDNMTALQFDKHEKYKNQVNKYSPDIQDWLVNIYDDYGNMLNRLIRKPIFEDRYFFLHYKPEEFETLTFDVYAKLIKKYPYLHGQHSRLLRLIVETHRIESENYEGFPKIDDTVDQWISETYEKYEVNLLRFAENWCAYYYDHPNIWPAVTKKKTEYVFLGEKYDYDYTKSERNQFGIDSLYRDIPKHGFLRGKKQELLTLLLYTWITWETGDPLENSYWIKYTTILKNSANN